jgi:large subunit ribosomal protein L24
MKTSFATTWKKSIQPRKQRKYIHNAPAHIKGKFLASHLSPQLREKHARRAIRVRKGDKVKVLRGSHKGKEGKVDRIDVTYTRVYVTGVDHTKRDGAKALAPLNPSNIMIIELNLDDKQRKAKLESKATKAKKE